MRHGHRWKRNPLRGSIPLRRRGALFRFAGHLYRPFRAGHPQRSMHALQKERAPLLRRIQGWRVFRIRTAFLEFWYNSHGGGDFKDGAANGVDTIYYKPRAIYVGECKDGVPHGNGILYTRIGTISKYYFREGQFENGKLISGFLSNYYGTFPVIGGTTSTGYRKEFSKIDLYSQSELTSKYESLRALKPKKFLGAELTEEQRLFLDEKLSSEQILSIRKSQ